MKRLIVVAILLVATSARAMTVDPDASLQQPGNALVAPFDASDGHASFFQVSNVTDQPVAVHWQFYSELCDHLANFSTCLTPRDTLVVDPNHMGTVNEDNEFVGSTVSVAGQRGIVIATAYAGGEDECLKGIGGLVDEALIGTFTVADIASGAGYGNSMARFGLSNDGSFTRLPRLEGNSFNLQTFNPESLDNSYVALLTVKEQTGDKQGELGSLGVQGLTLRAETHYTDNTETETSLPDLAMSCAKFTQMLPGVMPEGFYPVSGGFVNFENFRLIDLYGAEQPTDGVWFLALHGQSVGTFGSSQWAHYSVLPATE